MRMQAKGPGAGWSWLIAGLTVARQHPGRIIGAAALLGVFLALPTAVQMLAKPRGAAIPLALGAIMLISGVIYPILIGGFMRVLDAARNDRAGSAFDVFDPFRPGRGALRLALFGVCMLASYAAFLAIVLTTIGRGVAAWYLHLVTLQSLGTPLQHLPPLPAGFSTTFALLTVFFIFYSGAMAVGIGQVSLRGASPWAGFRDGVAGAFKNVLPLVVLVICALVAFLVLAVGAGITIAIAFLLGHFVGAAFGLVLGALLYVAVLLFLIAAMMGINYAIWHDVASDGAGGSAAAALPGAAG